MANVKDKILISEEAKALVEKAIFSAVEKLNADIEIDVDGGLLGIEVVEVKFSKEHGKLNVTVFIWKKGGIAFEDCEIAHNAVDVALDKLEDLFPSDYVLNVSSMGLDRKIVSDDDFRRATGTEIEVVEESGKQHGTLISYDAESFTIRIAAKKPHPKAAANDESGSEAENNEGGAAKSGAKSPKDIQFDRNNGKTLVQPYIRF